MSKDLIEGAYYYTENGIEKAHYCEVNGVRELVTPKAKVIDPVPSYEEWQEEQKSLKVLAEAYCEEKEENQQLKELLKECKGLIDVERLSLKGVVIIFDKIDNAIGEKK